MIAGRRIRGLPDAYHNLAYLLMKEAGVPCIEMRQVPLTVNGQTHGLYSEYPDPDNKKWLKRTFGTEDDDFVGDFYKAATDKPNLTKKYLADLAILGTDDSSYYLHYNKKTNDTTIETSADYSSIKKFIRLLNETPDAQFADTIDKYFDITTFLKYLVVANYTSFWDGYPNRAKNYWLYHNPNTQKWNFIPWDMDATFDPVRTTLNNMGTQCSYLFMFGQTDVTKYYTSIYKTNDNGKSEITPRPLFTRIMSVKKFQDIYASEYRHALSSYLKKEILLNKADSLAAYAQNLSIPEPDRLDIDTSLISTRLFIEQRNTSLDGQLQGIPQEVRRQNVAVKTDCVSVKKQHLSIEFTNNNQKDVRCRLFLVDGRKIQSITLSPHSSSKIATVSKGLYLYEIDDIFNNSIQRGFLVTK